MNNKKLVEPFSFETLEDFIQMLNIAKEISEERKEILSIEICNEAKDIILKQFKF